MTSGIGSSFKNVVAGLRKQILDCAAVHVEDIAWPGFSGAIVRDGKAGVTAGPTGKYGSETGGNGLMWIKSWIQLQLQPLGHDLVQPIGTPFKHVAAQSATPLAEHQVQIDKRTCQLGRSAFVVKMKDALHVAA
ncbi:hypothetical protein DNK49_04070 [Azoarcus communis]|uniref:Uncharacterized protein n=1 Tax=Parazoarcus communis SWub3 = DSM 12120 TaxID=1121029 RepID=A0A323UZ13_9RHOO|nr:hypothetical protein DNK49_04070 [Azoarcus communis] [Parazoarcus communis SWub3 = DSM 12120]